ncbi:MAG TPA: Ig-like domain-containing protein [Candidatus Limivicinus faecipullorum]|nr:Ig-like domain-containing protein [Candidatus Limivicinus faecipullorum]
MKKKIIAMTLYIALLLTSLIPVTALAVGDEGDGTGPSVRSATELSISGVSLAPKTYDGKTDGTVESVSFSSTDDSVTAPTLTPGVDYTATVEYDSANAGDNRTATVTVMLKNPNYTFSNGSTTTYIQKNQTISHLPVALDWGSTSFFYDGTEKSVFAAITNLVGDDQVSLIYGGTTSATEARADNYTASVTDLEGADAGNYTLTGVTNLSQEWSIKIDISSFTVSCDLTSSPLTYTGQSCEPDSYLITVYDSSSNSLNPDTDYTLSYANNVNAGDDAKVIVTGTGKYAGIAEGFFTILPAKLSIGDVTLATKTYDGKTGGTVTDVSFTGVPPEQTLKLGVDYTATVEYDSADAGDGKTATVTVTLKNSNYSLKVNTFTLPNQTIEKADYEGNKTADGYIVADSSLHSVKLPDIPEGASYGKPEYSGGDDAVTSLSITDGILHYSGGSITSGSKYTVTVPVAGGNNYEDYDITVSLTGSDNVVLSGEPTLSSDTITYGQKLSDITLSGSMYAGATQVSGVFTWNAPNTMPGAGTYPAQWTFTSNEGTATDSTQITVKQRPVELDWGTTVFTYDGEPHSVSATISNVVGNDDVQPVYGGTTSATDIETYTATVTGLNGTNAGNYTLVGVSNVSQEWSIKSPVTLVSSVTMSRSSLRIYEGKSYSLSAAVSPADATDKSLYWGSSNPDIATVDQNGKVTGKAPGVCTIFAQAQDGSKVFAACSVRVLHWYPGATPITGDSSHLGLWIGVLAVSACAIGAAAFILIKKRKSK